MRHSVLPEGKGRQGMGKEYGKGKGRGKRYRCG